VTATSAVRNAIVLALIGWLSAANPCVVRAQGQRPLQVSVTPSAIAPGSVMRVDVRGASDRPVTATIFGRALPFSFDGHAQVWTALAGVDLDTRPGLYGLRVRQDDVPNATRMIRVAPKRFPVRRLRVAEAFVNPPAEAIAQIEADSRLLAATYGQTTPRRWEGSFRLPVDGKPSSNFGTRSYYNGQPRSPHAGVDFMSESGTPVFATNHGTVVVAAPLYFTGNTVIIDHGAQLFSVYAHLSELQVKAGDDATPDTVIGLVGSTGRVTGPHLHWSVRLTGARVDPLTLVALTQAP
jgi:murein DD-endopeptidase MepM/ murein hydrolase activator NlpD